MYRILVIDDEADVRDLYRSMLEDEPYEVMEAENGNEALALAKEYAYDLVLTDIMMPKMTGLDFIGKLHMIDPHAKVVIITGFDDISYNRKAIEFGAWRYLVKPVGRADLITIVASGVKARAEYPFPKGLKQVDRKSMKKKVKQEQPPAPAPEPEKQVEEAPQPKQPAKPERLGELFDETARELLEFMQSDASGDAVESKKDEIDKRVMRPFMAFFDYVMRHLPEDLQEVLEFKDDCFPPLLHKSPQGLAIHPYIVGGAHPKGASVEEAGQLFMAMNGEVLQYGFTIGEFGDDSQLRFINHVREHVDDLRPLIHMLAESMSFGPMLVRLFELDCESTALITTDSDSLASLHVVVNLPLKDYLDETLANIRRRMLQDYANLYPLIILAEDERPMPEIRSYLGLPPESPKPETTSDKQPPARQQETELPPVVASPAPEPPMQEPTPVTRARRNPGVHNPGNAIARNTSRSNERDDLPHVQRTWMDALRRRGQVLFSGADVYTLLAARSLAEAAVHPGEDGFVKIVPLQAHTTYDDLMARNTETGVVAGALPIIFEEANANRGVCALILDGVDKLTDCAAFDVCWSFLDVRGASVALPRGAVRLSMPRNLYVIATAGSTEQLPSEMLRRFVHFEVGADFEWLLAFAPASLAETLKEVLQEMYELAPSVDLTMLHVRNLLKDLPVIWREDVEPMLEARFDCELIDEYRWESVSTRLLNDKQGDTEEDTETGQAENQSD